MTQPARYHTWSTEKILKSQVQPKSTNSVRMTAYRGIFELFNTKLMPTEFM